MSAVTISIMLKDVIAMRRREPIIVNIVGFARQPTVFPLRCEQSFELVMTPSKIDFYHPRSLGM